MKETTDKTLNVYQKMLQVVKAVQTVKKTGHNSFHNYDYATEEDILSEVREHLVYNGLVVTNSVSEHSREGQITTIGVDFTITNIDNPTEQIQERVYGTGQDQGDKGVYKAMTGAMKYFFTKTFLISTGDDPEKDGEHKTANKPAPVAQVEEDQAPWEEEQEPPQNPESKPCPKHPTTTAYRKSKDGKVWYSHKLGDGWCNG